MNISFMIIPGIFILSQMNLKMYKWLVCLQSYLSAFCVGSRCSMELCVLQMVYIQCLCYNIWCITMCVLILAKPALNREHMV